MLQRVDGLRRVYPFISQWTLGCFHLLATVGPAGRNMRVQVFVGRPVCSSLGVLKWTVGTSPWGGTFRLFTYSFCCGRQHRCTHPSQFCASGETFPLSAPWFPHLARGVHNTSRPIGRWEN